MKNKTEDSKLNALEKFHLDSQQWKSSFHLMKDELLFIEELLHSYVFEPDTPNLFERLQDYLERLKTVNEYKTRLEGQIVQHENKLGGALECRDGQGDEDVHAEHEQLKANVVNCLQQFQVLKSEVFNYAGGILKKRRPD
jgi:hypothetical protein